jgi:hypothetical protein
MFHFFSWRLRRAAHLPGSGGPRYNWLRPAALAALLLGIWTIWSLMPDGAEPTVAAEPQMVPGQQQQEVPLDQPLRMIADARQQYTQIRDYTCTLITQERVKGQLLPEQIIQLSFRKDPFSVYMKWLAPKDKTSQEVAYVNGKNNNKMRVHTAIGWLDIAVNSPKVMENSRHYITETGIGNLIERCETGWQNERYMNKNKVQIAEYEYNKRRCIRVETTHTDKDARFYCYRSVTYFDKETKLPIRMECYDWPRPGGPQDGELLECFSYIDIRFNVNLPDATFNK